MYSSAVCDQGETNPNSSLTTKKVEFQWILPDQPPREECSMQFFCGRSFREWGSLGISWKCLSLREVCGKKENILSTPTFFFLDSKSPPHRWWKRKSNIGQADIILVLFWEHEELYVGWFLNHRWLSRALRDFLYVKQHKAYVSLIKWLQ